MKAGAELDREIHERVMRPTPHPSGWPDFIPPYSTEIECAWVVVDKIVSTGLDVTTNTWRGESRCCIDKAGPDGDIIQIADAFGETAPLAICLAAIRATEGKGLG